MTNCLLKLPTIDNVSSHLVFLATSIILLKAPLIRIFALLHESPARKHIILMQCLSSDSLKGGSGISD